VDKSKSIARLREHGSELKAAGVVHLSLFGSYARGTAVEAASDVDGRLESRLAELLWTKVDLSSPEWMKES
jgi:predicted nucleotidyltransferase